jgi:hypothetical protein
MAAAAAAAGGREAHDDFLAAFAAHAALAARADSDAAFASPPVDSPRAHHPPPPPPARPASAPLRGAKPVAKTSADGELELDDSEVTPAATPEPGRAGAHGGPRAGSKGPAGHLLEALSGSRERLFRKLRFIG